MEWNPHAPNTYGPEYPAGQDGRSTIPAAHAIEIVSTVTETIDQLQLPLSVIAVPGRRWMVDIYDLAAGITNTDDPQVDYAYPNADQNRVGVLNEGGGTTTLWSRVNEDPVDHDDYIEFSSANERIDFEFDTAAIAAAIAGRRVYKVEGRIVAAASSKVPTRYRLGLVDGGSGQGYAGRDLVLTRGAGGVVSWGELNFVDNTPWDPNDVAKFDNGQLFMRIRRVSTHKSVSRIARVRLAFYTVEEKRVARGTAVVNASTLQTFPLETASGADDWAKQTGKTYVAVLRRSNVSTEGQIGWRWISSDRYPPDGAKAYPQPTVSVNGVVRPSSSTFGSLGKPFKRIYPYGLVRTDAALSVDTQPYRIGLVGTVYTGSPVNQQEFTPSTSGDYRFLHASIAVLDDRTPPTDDLIVRIRRRADNVQMGGDLVVDADLFLDSPRLNVGNASPRLVKGNLATPASLVAGVQYYVEWTSATPSTNPWYVRGYAAWDATDWPDRGFGGDTDDGTYNGVESDLYELYFQLATLPDAPDNLVAAGVTQNLTALVDDCGNAVRCSIGSLNAVQLTWTPSTIGADFDHYSIERLDTIDPVWREVARILNEAIDEWVDYEARIGVASSYRIRAVRNDGALSLFTTALAYTRTGQQAALYLTSNVQSALNLAFVDVYGNAPERTYEFADAQAVVTQRILGRNGHVAFQPTESRLDAFSRLVQLNNGGDLAVTVAGKHVADAVRALSRADVPYVCVTDSEGGRWFANVRVPSLRDIKRSRIALAQLDVLELTDEPWQVEVT